MTLPPLTTGSTIDPKTRDLMLRVFDGDCRVLPHLHRMANLVRIDEVLEYLIREGITGRKFIAWLDEKHRKSLLKAMSFILMRVNRDLIVRPLIHGKDLL